MDVCMFLSLENTSSMRYSDKVKEFWKIEFKLFHGKWLRFMGGPKHRGQLLLYLYFCFVFYIFIIHFWIFLHYHLRKMCSCKKLCLLYSSAFKPVTFCQWSFILFMYTVVWRSFYSCHQTSFTIYLQFWMI
jgi:hypothetical protein